MATVLNVRQQLHDLCERVGVAITSYGAECSEPLRKALLSGLFTNVAEHRGEGKYHTVRLGYSLSLSHIQNSYLPVIGVHEMHGRMHPNYWQITILLVVDLCSSLAYFMMTQSLPIAGKLPIKTLVAKQLPTNIIVQCHTS